MSETQADLKTKKRKKYKKNLNKINFDEEVITRSRAENLVEEYTKNEEKLQEEKKPKPSNSEKKKPKRKKANKEIDELNEANNVNDNSAELAALTAAPATNEVIEGIDKTKEESIRAKKRKKLEQLQKDTRNKTDLAMQSKCLNYLSMWKHSRDNWKFEKLKQVWLQQNMFDDSKIPDDFWDILVEYFSKAAGMIRDTIIKESTKIIEEGNSQINEEEDEKDSVKVIRARNIIQFMQD